MDRERNRAEVVKGIEYLRKVGKIRQHRNGEDEHAREHHREVAPHSAVRTNRCEAPIRTFLLTFALPWTLGNECFKAHFHATIPMLVINT